MNSGTIGESVLADFLISKFSNWIGSFSFQLLALAIAFR